MGNHPRPKDEPTNIKEMNQIQRDGYIVPAMWLQEGPKFDTVTNFNFNGVSQNELASTVDTAKMSASCSSYSKRRSIGELQTNCAKVKTPLKRENGSSEVNKRVGLCDGRQSHGLPKLYSLTEKFAVDNEEGNRDGPERESKFIGTGKTTDLESSGKVLLQNTNQRLETVKDAKSLPQYLDGREFERKGVGGDSISNRHSRKANPKEKSDCLFQARTGRYSSMLVPVHNVQTRSREGHEGPLDDESRFPGGQDMQNRVEPGNLPTIDRCVPLSHGNNRSPEDKQHKIAPNLCSLIRGEPKDSIGDSKSVKDAYLLDTRKEVRTDGYGQGGIQVDLDKHEPPDTVTSWSKRKKETCRRQVQDLDLRREGKSLLVGDRLSTSDQAGTLRAERHLEGHNRYGLKTCRACETSRSASCMCAESCTKAAPCLAAMYKNDADINMRAENMRHRLLTYVMKMVEGSEREETDEDERKAVENERAKWASLESRCRSRLQSVVEDFIEKWGNDCKVNELIDYMAPVKMCKQCVTESLYIPKNTRRNRSDLPFKIKTTIESKEVKEGKEFDAERSIKVLESSPVNEEWHCSTPRKMHRQVEDIKANSLKVFEKHKRKCFSIDNEQPVEEANVETNTKEDTSESDSTIPEENKKIVRAMVLRFIKRIKQQQDAISNKRPLCEPLAATLGVGGPVWLLEIMVDEERFEALVDTGASRSFVAPSIVIQTKWSAEELDNVIKFKVASGDELLVEKVVKAAKFVAGPLHTSVDLLVAKIPYSIILGTDWLQQESLVWDFKSHNLIKCHKGKRLLLPVEVQRGNVLESEERVYEVPEDTQDKQLANEARERMEEDVKLMKTEEATKFVRPTPKRYKRYKRLHKMVPIKRLLKELTQRQAEGQLPAEGLQLINNDDAISGVGNEGLVYKGSIKENRFATKLRDVDQRLGDIWVAGDCAAVTEYKGPTYLKLEAWIEGPGRECPASIRECICKYKEIFMDSLPPGLPPERVISHTITLVPGKLPSKGAIYRLGPEELEAQRQILKQLKDAKWITMTSSPFAAPSMLVTKKDDGSGKTQYRMVVNYQELNAMTISPEFPLPTIQEILDLLHGAKVFTTIDMEQGFHQIRVDPKDQYKTAFRTCMGQYEYKVMPFGLRGAPGTFQAVMNHMFFDLLGKGVIAYLDDLLVYSPDVQSHARLLDKVLSILKKNKMYPKISKCTFGATSIEYLGYKVGAEGITPSPSKVQAISIWPEQLENETQVKQFLGTVNYCRMFMGPKFAETARPLIELTKKGAAFKWTTEHTAAIQALKDKLVNYVTLQIPDTNKPYVLKTDASGYAVGAVLEQDGKPLGFLSKKMSPAEQRYSTYDQELLALIRALEKWRRLLLTADVTVYTDHRALQYLQQVKGDKYVRGRIARWLIFLADFQNLKIKYYAGSSNVAADGLSRHPAHQQERKELLDEREINTTAATVDEVLFAVTQPEENTIDSNARYQRATVPDVQQKTGATHKLKVGGEQWVRALEECTVFGDIYKRARHQEDVVLWDEVNSVRREFKAKGNLLFIRLQGLWRICVPSAAQCKQHVLYQCHDHPTAGHMGVHKTYDMLARLYYWPGIRNYARVYVESCPRCKQAKSISTKPAGLLQSLQIPARRWANVSLDFITGLPETKMKNDAILTLVDTMSKMAHFIPTQTTVTAEGVVSLLADRLVRYHGLPAVLVSDRDPRFTAEVWDLMCKRFDIKRALSSSWHPESDGQTERVHRTIEQVLRAYIQSDENAWEDLLPAAELAYNCTVHNSTGLTPFEVMIGENPLRAADLDIVDELSPTISPPMTKLFQQLVDRAAAHILEAQAAQQYYANKHRRDVQFRVGDKVWLSTRYMQPRGTAKFQPRFIGPFPVIARIGKAAYRLRLPPSMTQHPVFHVSLLQKDKPRPQDMGEAEGWDPLVEQGNGEDPVYEVEHILDSRGKGDKEEFLVKWKGFPESAASWEPLQNLEGSRKLLRAFRATRTRQANKKKNQEKS